MKINRFYYPNFFYCLNRFFSPPSLALRLVSFIGLAAVIAFLTFSAIMIHSVEKHFEEQDLYDLKKVNLSLSNILNSKEDDLDNLFSKVKSAVAEQSNLFVYVKDERGNVVFTPPNGPNLADFINGLTANGDIDQSDRLFISNEMISIEAEAMHHAGHESDKKSTYRVMSSPVNVYINHRPVTYTLFIVMSADFHFHYIQELKSNLAIAAFVICLLIIVMVLFSVYQGHAPLRNVSKKIASITSENLNTRLQPDAVPIELRQLVTSFNVMLERIEDVFKRQANFSGDIAHEMRTPITNLVTQTQFILNQTRSVEDYQNLLYSNLEEYERMAKMISDMLFLAQADNRQLIIDKVAINLKDEVIKVFEYFEAWAEDKGVSLRLHCEGDSPIIQGDPAMLRRVINNLLSNAIRYTPKEKTVTVSLVNKRDGVYLSVINPGEQIPAEHLTHLFDRFYRIDPSRQRKGDGSGIGLAIVKSIVEAHHGRVSVNSNSQSTNFSVFLPKRGIG